MFFFLSVISFKLVYFLDNNLNFHYQFQNKCVVTVKQML
jgi:hypothetical protein